MNETFMKTTSRRASFRGRNENPVYLGFKTKGRGPPCLADVAFLLSALTLEDNALELFEDDELLVRVVDFRVALFFAHKKASFLEALQFALDVTGIFLDKLGKAANVRFKVWVLGIDNNNLAANSAGDEDV
jgi:hypothetical protein